MAAITLALPYSPLAGPFGLTAVPMRILAALAGSMVGYVGVNELVKRRTRLAACRIRGRLDTDLAEDSWQRGRCSWQPPGSGAS